MLWASEADGRLDIRRSQPSKDLAPFIQHYGCVQWDLRSPFEAETLPDSGGRIEVEWQNDVCRAELVGLRTERYGNRRTGQGQFVIVQFRAATLQPLLGAAMSSITDRALPLARVLGPRADAWVRSLRCASSTDVQFALTESFLREVIPALPPAVAAVRDLVERIGSDADIRRVEQVAELAALDMRTLQRRFRAHVGVHPKWVIQRYRLQEAAQQLRAAAPVPLAHLASDLGYADQAHFARDFRRVVGHPPGHFARKASV